MIRSLRTYRTLRVLVAFTALLSIGLPLVRYACAMTGITGTAPSAMAGMGCSEHMDSEMADMKACGDDPMCPEKNSCDAKDDCSGGATDSDALSCCKLEAAEKEKTAATESKLPLSKIALPLAAILTNTDAAIAPALTYSKQEASLVHGGGVSIRVLHASFLI